MGELTGPNPGARGKAGSKDHLVIDGRGIPLAVGLSAANTHDSVLLEQLVDAVPPVKGPRDARGGRAGGPPSCIATRGTTIRAAVERCVDGGSARGSPGVELSPQSGWVGIAGGSSAALPGWWTSATYRSAMAVVPTTFRPSSI